MHLDQVALLLAQAALVAGALVILYHKRATLGSIPLFVAVGVFQYAQVVLATFVYIDIEPFGPVSPGSMVLFTSTLFVFLLIYVHEDVVGTRDLLCGLVLANVVVAAMSFAAAAHLDSPIAIPSSGITAEMFRSSGVVLAVGTACLVLDVILLVVVYEWLSPRVFGSLARIYLSVTLVLVVDQALFTAGLFHDASDFGARIVSGWLGKATSGGFYSLVLWAYLRWGTRAHESSKNGRWAETFRLLSYRQKFEALGRDHEAVVMRASLQEDELKQTRERLVEETTDRQLAELLLQNREQRLAVLSRELIRAQESERRNLARELHDEVGQLLTALKLELHALGEGVDVQPDAVARGQQIVDQTIEQIRSLSLGLRPAVLDDLGLVPALEFRFQELERLLEVVIEFEDGLGGRRLDEPLETVLFRISQEALTNIARHAEATTVSIRLACDSDQVHLSIQDNGRGFDLDAAYAQVSRRGGLGLLGMIERAELAGGSLHIDTSPGAGTVIRFSCPIASAEVGAEIAGAS